MVRIHGHEAFLIQTKVREEFCILPEMGRQLLRGLVNGGEIVRSLVSILKDVLIFEEASLPDEDFDVVVNWEEHELPVDCVKNLTLHVDDDISGISLMDHIIECVSTWILRLQIFGRNQECHKRDQDGIIISFVWHFRGVKIHQVDGVVDRLIVALEAVSNIAEVINTFDSFL